MMENFQKKILPIEEISQRFRWLEYVKLAGKEPKDYRIRCGLCNKYSKLANIKKQDMDKISWDEGILKANPSLNKNKMIAHEQGLQHRFITQWLKAQTAKNLKNDDYPTAIGKLNMKY